MMEGSGSRRPKNTWILRIRISGSATLISRASILVSVWSAGGGLPHPEPRSAAAGLAQQRRDPLRGRLQWRRQTAFARYLYFASFSRNPVPVAKYRTLWRHEGIKELTLLRVDSVTHISISTYFVSCNPLLPCNLFLSVGNKVSKDGGGSAHGQLQPPKICRKGLKGA